MPQQQVVSIGQIAQYEGQDIAIQGWLRHRRSSGKLSFFNGQRWHRRYSGDRQ